MDNNRNEKMRTMKNILQAMIIAIITVGIIFISRINNGIERKTQMPFKVVITQSDSEIDTSYVYYPFKK